MRAHFTPKTFLDPDIGPSELSAKPPSGVKEKDCYTQMIIVRPCTVKYITVL